MNQPTHHDSRRDQDWQATCYLLGELDPAATSAFERALADDQSAREALARAVEIVEGLRAGEARRLLITTTPARRWQVISLRLGMVLAASLLVALLIRYSSSPNGTAARDKELLADAWLATTQASASVESAVLSETADLWDANAPLWEETAASPAPDWMLLAISDLSSGTDHDMTLPSEVRPQ